MNVVIFWYILLRQCIKRSFISQKPGEGDLFGTRSLSYNSKYFLFHNIVNVYGLTIWNLHKLTVPRATAINLTLLMPCEDSRLSEVEPMKRYVNITGGGNVDRWIIAKPSNLCGPQNDKKNFMDQHLHNDDLCIHRFGDGWCNHFSRKVKALAVVCRHCSLATTTCCWCQINKHLQPALLRIARSISRVLTNSVIETESQSYWLCNIFIFIHSFFLLVNLVVYTQQSYP